MYTCRFLYLFLIKQAIPTVTDSKHVLVDKQKNAPQGRKKPKGASLHYIYYKHSLLAAQRHFNILVIISESFAKQRNASAISRRCAG